MIPPRDTRPSHATSTLRHGCLLLLVLATAGAAAPLHTSLDGTGSVVGRIFGGEGRNPWVILFREGYGAPVDSNGVFRFPSLPVGPHTLLIRGYYCDPVQVPVIVKAGVVDSIVADLSCTPIPCPRPDKADPGCVAPDPYQRARVGTRCEVHHGERLRLDLVPIHHGFVTFIPGRNSEDERKRFPNAWPWAGGGCVSGPQKFTEVAYCPECRVAYQWESLRRLVIQALPGSRNR